MEPVQEVYQVCNIKTPIGESREININDNLRTLSRKYVGLANSPTEKVYTKY